MSGWDRFKQLRRIVRRYVEAKVEASWVGTLTDPEDIERVEKRVVSRRRALDQHIKYLEEQWKSKTQLKP